MLIAQFSDTHIKPRGRLAYSRVDTAHMLASAVDHLGSLPQTPELLVITGDLVDRGLLEEYEHLRDLLASIPMPVLLVPGNHDDRETMRRAFPEHDYVSTEGFWQFALSRAGWPVRIVGIDTIKPFESGGLLCSDRLLWLDQTLGDAPDQPTLLVMHHPPFVTGIGHMDDIGLEGQDALAEILSRHQQVRLVSCGHLHRNIRTTLGGRAVMTAPSTAHTVQLDIARDAAPMFRMEPPGYLLHWWNGQDIVTHHVQIAASEGPYPFFEDDGRLIE
jgi:3',5'-cyclic AMP phosphodiesterase CpdA